MADTPWTDQALLAALANREGSLLPAWRLYLPKKWTDDTKRCKAAVVPQTVGFATKGTLARAHIEAALATGIPKGIVLADAGYGDEAAFGDQLQECGLSYAVGIRQTAKLWWGKYQPDTVPEHTRGRPRMRLKRDAAHQPTCLHH